jgi:hypothetical protein
VDLVNDDGSIRHLTVSHANPVLRDLAFQFQQVAFSEPESGPERLRRCASGSPCSCPTRGVEAERPAAGGPDHHSSSAPRRPLADQRSLIVRGRSSARRRSRPRPENTRKPTCAWRKISRSAPRSPSTRPCCSARPKRRTGGQDLSTVAHELRALTSVLGWVQLARANPDLSEEALACIDESATLCACSSKISSTSPHPGAEAPGGHGGGRPATIVRSALDIAAAGAHRNEIRLQLAIESAPLRGDRVRLLQVVWNLLSNAIKFSPPGSPIDVRLERDGNDVRLSVIDSGVGISAEFRPHVFELYRQADMSAGASRTGLGIGLSIVEQIVKLHGGTIRVESPGLDQGASFFVTLPLCVPIPAEPAPPARSGRRSGTSRRVAPATVAPRTPRSSDPSPSKPRTA